MRMTIAVVGKDGHPVDGPSAEFDEDGGTIGRRVDCTLVIADEQRHISRVHALVEFRGDYFCIVDKGSYLAVCVNGLRVGRGQETPIFEGDEIVIGGYTMRVVHVAAAWDLDATLAVPALTVPGSTRLPAAASGRAVPSEHFAQAGPPAGAIAVGPPDTAKPSDSPDASSDGDSERRRKPRSRRKPVRPEPREVPLEALRDNPTATHEPGRTLPPEESVARLLVAESGSVIPDFDISAEGGIPGASVAERPGQSTFDLLADRLLEKGDLAYDPFMPSVWDERARLQALAGSGPAHPEPEPEGRSEVAWPVCPGDDAEAVAEGALPSAACLLNQAETPEPEGASSEPRMAVDAIVGPTLVAEAPASELLAPMTAEPDEAPPAVEAAVGDASGTVATGIGTEAGTTLPRVEAASVDEAETDGTGGASHGVSTADDDAVAIDAEARAIPDADVLARVVRRRYRGAPGRPEAPVAAYAASAVDADRPEIVLVLQPLAGGEEGPLVVPIRRRNRRTPQMATH